MTKLMMPPRNDRTKTALRQWQKRVIARGLRPRGNLKRPPDQTGDPEKIIFLK